MQQTKTDAPPQSAADPEQKFSRDEAARYLGISRRTLEGWAVRGGGPRMLKLGSRVVYRRRDLDAWVTTRERASTSDRGAGPGR
jgi:excisionase family DNA binding protein